MKSWGTILEVLALGLLLVGCKNASDQNDDVTPEQACAQLFELCPEFPLPEEECVARAEAGAPQRELNCVGNSDDCYEAVECLGYTPEQYDAAVLAAQMGMGGVGD